MFFVETGNGAMVAGGGTIKARPDTFLESGVHGKKVVTI